METIYVETTVIGHIAGRLYSDPVVAARQELTRTWWTFATRRYRLLISEVVWQECQAGDPDAAQERIDVIEMLEVLDLNDAVRELARRLIESGAVPATEPRDALHIALAAVHRIQYMVTWNFKHIANASLRARIEAVCRASGCMPPMICTPEELTDETDVTEESD